MEQSNKPQWLIDAEKAMQEFNETPASKMTDGEINRSSWARSNGLGKQHLSGKTKEMVSKGHKTKKEGYYKSEAFRKKQGKFGKRGGKKRSQLPDFEECIRNAVEKSLESRAIVRHEKYTNILNSIAKEEFSSKEIHDATNALGYEKSINLRFMIKNGYIEKSYNGTPGSKTDVTRYKRIQK